MESPWAASLWAKTESVQFIDPVVPGLVGASGLVGGVHAET